MFDRMILIMRCDHADEEFPLPQGYFIRCYQPGEEDDRAAMNGKLGIFSAPSQRKRIFWISTALSRRTWKGGGMGNPRCIYTYSLGATEQSACIAPMGFAWQNRIVLQDRNTS